MTGKFAPSDGGVMFSNGAEGLGTQALVRTCEAEYSATVAHLCVSENRVYTCLSACLMASWSEERPRNLNKRILCRPGGIRQQFKAALPMVETILKGLKETPQLQGPLQVCIYCNHVSASACLQLQAITAQCTHSQTLLTHRHIRLY